MSDFDGTDRPLLMHRHRIAVWENYMKTFFSKFRSQMQLEQLSCLANKFLFQNLVLVRICVTINQRSR